MKYSPLFLALCIFYSFAQAQNAQSIITSETLHSFDYMIYGASTPNAEPTDDPNRYAEQAKGRDQAPMIYISAGPFLMGSAQDNPQALPSEQPEHEVTLNAFWIDKYEVSVAQFAQCVSLGFCTLPMKLDSATRESYFHSPEFADYPVINVTWQQAFHYCAWAGKRLPSEAEWEKAARGTDRRIYPWGNEIPDPAPMNIAGYHAKDTMKRGEFPNGASFYGVMDMAGNVWEWANDRYAKYYYRESPSENPTGDANGYDRVLRGMGWSYSFSHRLITLRAYANENSYANDIGFRCAMDIEQ